jgi:hypothetical protein
MITIIKPCYHNPRVESPSGRLAASRKGNKREKKILG